tara:strand:- start:46 stop:510 length:465 start_codon:yes stop_codon:yes gene_type:complete
VYVFPWINLWYKKMDDAERVNIHLNSRYDVLARHRGTGDLSSFFSNPRQYRCKPSEEDYRRGFIDRFFVRKNTSPNYPICEIDNAQFQIIRKNPFYVSAVISWKLTGVIETREDQDGEILGVSDYNKLSTLRGDTFIPGIENFLQNPLEFYKEI